MLGIIGGGVVGGALGYGAGVLVNKATGIIGLSITKYYLLPVKSITLLGKLDTYVSIAERISAGYFLIPPEKYQQVQDLICGRVI